MNNRFYPFLIIALLTSFQLCGQDINQDSIQWTSPSWFDPSTSANVDEATTVISSPGSIIWKTQNDSIKYTFTVRKSNGTWSNVNNDGSVMFEADSGNDSAVIEFKKSNGHTIIRILIVRPDETLIYVLDVTNTAVL